MFGGDSARVDAIKKEKYLTDFIPDTRLKLLLWLFDLQESGFPLGKNDLSIPVWKALKEFKNMLVEFYREQNGISNQN